MSLNSNWLDEEDEEDDDFLDLDFDLEAGLSSCFERFSVECSTLSLDLGRFREEEG